MKCLSDDKGQSGSLSSLGDDDAQPTFPGNNLPVVFHPPAPHHVVIDSQSFGPNYLIPSPCLVRSCAFQAKEEEYSRAEFVVTSRARTLKIPLRGAHCQR